MSSAPICRSLALTISLPWSLVTTFLHGIGLIVSAFAKESVSFRFHCRIRATFFAWHNIEHVECHAMAVFLVRTYCVGWCETLLIRFIHSYSKECPMQISLGFYSVAWSAFCASSTADDPVFSKLLTRSVVFRNVKSRQRSGSRAQQKHVDSLITSC